MKVWKSIVFCGLLAALLSFPAWATSPRSGDCGASKYDNVTWVLDSAGVLTISGSGWMSQYAYGRWAVFRDEITEVVIEDGIMNISGSAFSSCMLLTTATIPDSVEWIGAYAFSHCEGLNTITFGNGVKIIDMGAFEHCYKLPDFRLPDGLIAIGEEAFVQCLSLRNVIIPGSVGSMGESIYSGCRLESIVFGDGIGIIPSWILYGCDTIQTITIPASVIVMGRIFDEHTGAAPVIYYGGTERRWNALDNSEDYWEEGLTTKASRIYFESAGPDDESTFGINFEDILFDIDDYEYLNFYVNITGNVMKPVHFVIAMYDESGRILYNLLESPKVSALTTKISFSFWEMEDAFFDGWSEWKTLKVMALDDDFRPYCAVARWTRR